MKSKLPVNQAKVDKKHKEKRRKLLRSKDIPPLKFMDYHTETEKLPFVPP